VFYNIRYKRDKASGARFDPADFYGGLNSFEVDSAIIFFQKQLNIFDNGYLILYLISVPCEYSLQ